MARRRRLSFLKSASAWRQGAPLLDPAVASLLQSRGIDTLTIDPRSQSATPARGHQMARTFDFAGNDDLCRGSHRWAGQSAANAADYLVWEQALALFCCSCWMGGTALLCRRRFRRVAWFGG